MKTNELLQYFLPSEFIAYFDLVEIKDSNNHLEFILKEKNVRPLEYSSLSLESKGFTRPIRLQDFPIRDHKVELLIYRRSWRDINTGKVYTNNWNLSHQGTNYTKEFAAFLKKIY